VRKRSQTARAALGFVCGLAVLLAEGRVAATPAVVVSIETPPAVALGALSVEVQYDAALLTPLPAPPPELGVTVEPAEALVGRASIVMGAAPLPSRVALVVLSGEPGGISEVGDLLVLRMQRQAGQPGEGVLTLSAVEAYDRLGVAAPPPTVRVRLIEIDECGDGVLGPTELCEVGDSCCTNECQFAMAGSPCDDGIVCTTGDLCAGNAAQCLPGASDDAVCDNGLFCDGAERCDPGLGCQAGPAPAPRPRHSLTMRKRSRMPTSVSLARRRCWWWIRRAASASPARIASTTARWSLFDCTGASRMCSVTRRARRT